MPLPIEVVVVTWVFHDGGGGGTRAEEDGMGRFDEAILDPVVGIVANKSSTPAVVVDDEWLNKSAADELREMAFAR